MGSKYKPRFRIKITDYFAGDISLGIILNRSVMGEYIERYIYISLFKIGITIGFICD